MGLSWDGTYPYTEEYLRRRLPRGGTVLDAGAGEGRLGYLTGLEIHPPLVEQLLQLPDYDRVFSGYMSIRCPSGIRVARIRPSVALSNLTTRT